MNAKAVEIREDAVLPGDGPVHKGDGHGSETRDHSEMAGHESPGERGEHGGRGDHAGHGGHADHAAQFRDRFWFTTLLTIPVFYFSEMFQMLLDYEAVAFPGSSWLPALLGTLIFLYGGWPFLTGAVSEARARRPAMMLLIGLAITVAFVASWLTEVGFVDLDFWWELAALIAIMLLGHWQEMRAIGQASGALDALAELIPDEAEKVTEHGVEVVPLDRLHEGDVVLVRSGARVPADGEVVDGSADMDESMITGESRPVRRDEGDRVVAGTIATDTAIRVRIAALGENTVLAGIRRLVEEAQTSKSRAQALADRAAALLFYVAVTAGVITFVAWSFLGEPRDAIERTVTVLVIACPHALGLAIPLVISISTALSARSGILVKDRLALERMRKVTAVLFDKTGTLTAGKHVVTGTVAADGDERTLLDVAAAVESDSEHPLARAIVVAAGTDRHSAGSDFQSMTGRGVEASVEGRRIAVGGPALLRERGLQPADELKQQIADWKSRGAAVLYVMDSETVMGALALEDEIRPESIDAVSRLQDLKVKVVMITGDAHEVAEAVSHDIGIDDFYAEVLPGEKDKAVSDLQSKGHVVAMVGDGVNDAPALARADVGIAIGAGTDVAMESAGVVLASDDPRAVLDVIRLSRASYRKMVQNLVWATAYNLNAIPVAAGALAWAGIALSPAFAAVLMSVSTIVVALNAQLLRRTKLGPAAGRPLQAGG